MAELLTLVSTSTALHLSNSLVRCIQFCLISSLHSLMFAHADLSICPSNLGTNTYSVALTVGEKAAQIIAEDLGIKGF